MRSIDNLSVKLSISCGLIQFRREAIMWENDSQTIMHSHIQVVRLDDARTMPYLCLGLPFVRFVNSLNLNVNMFIVCAFVCGINRWWNQWCLFVYGLYGIDCKQQFILTCAIITASFAIFFCVSCTLSYRSRSLNTWFLHLPQINLATSVPLIYKRKREQFTVSSADWEKFTRITQWKSILFTSTLYKVLMPSNNGRFCTDRQSNAISAGFAHRRHSLPKSNISVDCPVSSTIRMENTTYYAKNCWAIEIVKYDAMRQELQRRLWNKLLRLKH